MYTPTFHAANVSSCVYHTLCIYAMSVVVAMMCSLPWRLEGPDDHLFTLTEPPTNQITARNTYMYVYNHTGLCNLFLAPQPSPLATSGGKVRLPRSSRTHHSCCRDNAGQEEEEASMVPNVGLGLGGTAPSFSFASTVMVRLPLYQAV